MLTTCNPPGAIALSCGMPINRTAVAGSGDTLEKRRISGSYAAGGARGAGDNGKAGVCSIVSAGQEGLHSVSNCTPFLRLRVGPPSWPQTGS
jgi:hypothetical protein